MKLPTRLGVIYGILVVLIISLGTWWVIFLTSEGRNYERYHLQRLTTDQIHAAFLIQTVDEIAEDPAGKLEDYFPELIFRESPDGTKVLIDPAAQEKVHNESRRRLRMFISEGIFFLFLLAGGTSIIILAYRREREFKSARELFLAGASHEFRTPMASLQLYAETLARPDLKAEDRDRITKSMKEDLHRLESLVDQVLAMSREEYLRHGETERLDVAHETDKVLSELEGFLKRNGARLETSLDEDCWFTGIRSALALAVSNLVQNAAVHSPPPVRIAVTLQRGESQHRLAVRDWGPPIPRRYRKKIFQSFFRIRKAGTSQGSGLGLYLVKRNMDLLGGKVEIRSEEGGGNTFTLVLPACEREDS